MGTRGAPGPRRCRPGSAYDRGGLYPRRMDFDLDQTLAILDRTPVITRAWLDGLPVEWQEASEGEGKWTPLDILGHLLHCEEDDWMPRTRILLEHGEARAFDAFDPEGFRARYPHMRFVERQMRFATERAANMVELRGLELTDAELDKRGTHPVFGPVTLREMLATWTVHDLTHLAQMARVMCRFYGGNVGPWKQFLPILQR